VGLASIASLMVAAPAGAQTGGVPGGTTTHSPAPPPPRPSRWAVYKPGTWYGPGFWGKLTACGTTLTPTTLGVAHRRLPCGTPDTFSYAGRSLSATRIDRGAFR